MLCGGKLGVVTWGLVSVSVEYTKVEIDYVILNKLVLRNKLFVFDGDTRQFGVTSHQSCIKWHTQIVSVVKEKNSCRKLFLTIDYRLIHNICSTWCLND